jgi:hypothetical protein
MRCSKCGGLMSFEQFMNTVIDVSPWSFEGWRCVHCGEIIDFLILLNRIKTRTQKHETAPVEIGTGSHSSV